MGEQYDTASRAPGLACGAVLGLLVFSDKELEKLKRRIEVRRGCNMEGRRRARGGGRQEKLRRKVKVRSFLP